ncbi:MAG: hypothetical protein Q7K35_06200 [bacterium]|nr:hypothetical protein [bacterium]
MPNGSQIDDQNDGLDDSFESKPSLNPVSKNQKMALAGLVVFAVLIVALWSVQLKNSIYGPLNSGSTGENQAALTSDQTVNDLALKNKDTDSDGLSDYDELYIYKTSPYLADSDSDNVNDGEEITKGTDANCPTGRTCATTEFSANNTGSTTPEFSTETINNLSNQSEALNSLLNQFNATNPANGSANQPTADSGTENLTAEQKELLKNVDPATLRQLLLQNGMDKATLDQISDTELMQSYSETLQ